MRIIRPRIEETLEFLRDRLAQAGFGAGRGLRVVLTGGACQLTGAPEAARRVLGGQVRVGRPNGVDGLPPEAAFSPAFAAVAGLFVYPQVAGREYFEPRREQRLANGLERLHVARGTVADGELLERKTNVMAKGAPTWRKTVPGESKWTQ